MFVLSYCNTYFINIDNVKCTRNSCSICPGIAFIKISFIECVYACVCVCVCACVCVCVYRGRERNGMKEEGREGERQRKRKGGKEKEKIEKLIKPGTLPKKKIIKVI